MGTSAKVVAARALVLFVVVLVGLACSSRSLLSQDGGDFSAGQNVSSGGRAAVAQSTAGTSPATGGAAVAQSTGGTSPATGGAGGSGAPDPIQQELMTRWNEAAATVPTANSFQWEAGKFPHPTYKMGTPQAYGEFAEVLLAFFQAGDNFDFLVQNQLFRLPLTFTLLTGDSTWTFEELANSFGTSSYGTPQTTRAAIAEFAARIQAILGPAGAAPPNA